MQSVPMKIRVLKIMALQIMVLKIMVLQIVAMSGRPRRAWASVASKGLRIPRMVDAGTQNGPSMRSG